MEDLRDPIGAKVRELRTAKGLTQAELAASAGVTVMAVSRIELGTRLPLPPTIRALARSLGVNPGDLFEEPSEILKSNPGRPRKVVLNDPRPKRSQQKARRRPPKRK